MSSRTKQQTLSLFAFGLFVLLAGRWVLAAGLQADMVIFNGTILTADSPDPEKLGIAEAAAPYDGKFIAVGTTDEVMEYAGPGNSQDYPGGPDRNSGLGGNS